MKILIDTDKRTTIWNYTEDVQVKTTIADLMHNYLGTKEYKGIVKTIQEWYYGTLIEASWCATAVSYFANQLNILEQIGGKNENVYYMMCACRTYANSHKDVRFYDKGNIPKQILKGDILFYLWNGTVMKFDSNKHVSICNESTTANTIPSIGGNQDDSISIKNYNRNNLYALYRPFYKY